MPSKFIPEPQVQANGRVITHNDHYYRDQVQSGGPFDTGFAFRWATASAKDKARNNLIDAVWNEQRQLRQENPFSSGDFRDQATANVLATREIDGVKGASDDAIKL